MSHSLPLLRQVLAKARAFQKLGCCCVARRLLDRLAQFRQLPTDVLVETRARLGMMCLLRRQFGLARRHLGVALLHRPKLAAGQYLMAYAVHARGRGDADRALDHLRRAVRLAPHRAAYWAALGRLLLKRGRPRAGVKCLRRAVRLAPADVRLLGRAVKALARAGQFVEARRLARAARFRHPHCPAVAKMWTDLRFQEIHARQVRRRVALATPGTGPTLLPFAGTPPSRLGGRTFRLDDGQNLQVPHLPRSLRLSDQKQA